MSDEESGRKSSTEYMNLQSYLNVFCVKKKGSVKCVYTHLGNLPLPRIEKFLTDM